VAYTAEIQIAVKGAKDLRSFQTELNKSSDAVDRLNRDIKTLSEGGIPRSFNNLNSLLAVAADNFNKVALGTQDAATAARDYVRAADEVNAGLRERAALLKQVADEERRARLASAGIREATQYGGPIGPGAATPIALASQLRGRTQQILDERKGADELAAALAELEERRRLETNAILDEKAAQVQLNLARQEEQRKFLAGAAQQYQYPIGPSQRSKRFRFGGDVSPERAEAALRQKEIRTQRQLNQQFFEEEKRQLMELDALRTANAQKQTQRLQALGKTIRGSLSSAAIGGAFPLLFGQSPQAAVGGAIGGLLGGAGGGFAGSLIGTALGEIEAAKAKTKELALELGFSSEQAKGLASAFEMAGRNSEQLQAALVNLQGLGLSVNETASAVKIAVELSKEYGGSVEKIAQAFADTLETGKVGVSTLNKFTGQGIPIQEKLADKLGVTRTKLLEMAKDGKVSVQQVTDALVEMGRQAENTADKGKTGFDRFTSAVAGIASAIASAAGAILKNLVPALDTVLTRLASIIVQATKAINLIADATVGELSSAVFGAGFARGTGFANKGNIDAIGKALSNLRPEVATSKEELDKIAAAAASAQAELSKFGGALGEYAVQTAQKQLSRVQTGIQNRRQQLGAPAPAIGIVDILAPANLPPNGKGKSKQERESEIPALQTQLALEQRIFELTNSIGQARLANNKATEAALQMEQILAERDAKISDINREKIPNAEKELKIARATTAANQQLVEASLTRQQNEQDRQKQLEELVQGYANETALLMAGTPEIRQRLELEQQIAKLKADGIVKTEAEANAIRVANADLEKQRTLREQLNAQQKMQSDLYQGIANQISGGIGSAIDAVTSSTENLGDALQDIGQQILTTVGQMLIFYGLAQALGALGGTDNRSIFSFLAKGFGYQGAANGAYWSGGFQAFADGGMVTRPTMGLIGEGGEAEYVIPASKMRGAMSRYASGARGSAVIPAGSDGGDGMATALAAPGAIDVRYTVERINQVDYVTADQFQRGMAQAAAQGASQGEQRALRSLQNNRSTRSRLGLR